MNDKNYLKLAIKQAELSVNKGGFPAGAIIVKNGKVISTGISIGSKINDPTAHAETAAIRQACKKLKTHDLSGAIMYGSLECCNMCFSAAYWSGISKIVYSCRKTPGMAKKLYYEGSVNSSFLNRKNKRKIKLVFIPDFEKESLSLIKKWEKKVSF